MKIMPSYAPCVGALSPARAYLADDPGQMSLDGLWAFTYHRVDPNPGANPEEACPSPRVSSEETIDVPSHWVLRGDGRWGAPAYTNVDFPFPVDPPFPPEDNPVGDYSRHFTCPKSWLSSGGQVRLRFEGVESQIIVWINGQWIGMARGSRLAHEFDVTKMLVPGENTVTLRVHQFSAGSYLEDQDQWWLPGVFRSVSLRYLPDFSIEDLWINTDYKAGQGFATLELRVRGAQSETLEASLYIEGLGASLLTLSRGEDGRYRSDSIGLGNVEPWSPQSPKLYAARVHVVGESGRKTEERHLRLGFRRVCIEDGVLMANGEPLTLNGVNRHEIRADEGRVFSEEFARADLELMKSMGINAIRTSHYPPHPRLLDLADEIGLWVMLEGDIETHGFEGNRTWIDNPSDDPRWEASYLDRTERAFERDKNHASIFCWSLGNESGTGRNLAGAARWLRERTHGRALVHYEGDHAMEYVDIYSRMYPTLEEVAAVLDDADMHAPVAVPSHASAAVDDGAKERIRSAPYIMCEYLHAMGTGPGGAAAYAEQMSHPRHAGGFVWEWRDHALWHTLPDGRRCLAYGGDFGEEVHDGNFVCDGLVDALSRPYAGTWAWIRSLAPDAPILQGRSQQSGGEAEERLRALACAASSRLSSDEAECGTVFDDRGRVESVGGLPIVAEISVYRAPTDNDRGRGPVDYWGISTFDLGPLGTGTGQWGVSHAQRWEMARLHLLRRTWHGSAREKGTRVLVERWAPPAAQFGLETRWSFAPVDGKSGGASAGAPLPGNCLAVKVEMTPYGHWPERIPRAGVRLCIPGTGWTASWVGETDIAYADMPGVNPDGFGCAELEDLWDVGVKPQEGGHRPGLKVLELRGEDCAFTIVPRSEVGWSASPWSEQELARAGHWEDLPHSNRTFVWLDAIQDGIGTRSCGPDARPEFDARINPLSIEFVVCVTDL
ncbi:glycoside hydrolase family 2 TIM barrel-domain containing protein [uncultured Actinomyces sp.]|uniref:glycoside hydrolase family 2 TIM barrel-domain containing protein n=1 Tax=uncultured Actinomyces sp. TaxID=249061 RepID=UPI0028EE6C2F|nr:glycoside hydrolase family 2 TIM barrel-domain containing protein [uncultured Actinomyces sp.]